MAFGGGMRVLYLANSPPSVTFRGGFGQEKKGGSVRLDVARGKEGVSNPPTSVTLETFFFFFKGDETKLLLTLQTIC